MQISADIHGLREVEKAIIEAFPRNPRAQRGILNSAMRAAAKKTIVPDAKSRALAGDGSGALSEAIGVRAQSLNRLAIKGRVAGVQVTPVRRSPKAVAMYARHYYNARGIPVPADVLTSGIRHGHLVEFGFFNKRAGRHVSARPFLVTELAANQRTFVRDMAAEVKPKIEARVKRQARRKAKRR